MSYLGRSAKLSLKAQEKVSFLATAGQTSKTGLSYTPSFVEVYVNGVLLTDTTDFTATNGNSITFTVALLLNDEVTVISLKTFTVADHYSKTEADTLLAAKATNTAVALKSPIASPVFTGNVGVGVIPEAWRANDFIGLQVGTGAAVYGRGSGDEDKAGLTSNAYYDNNNDRWQHIATKPATHYYQVSGQHIFYVAPSGSADAAISWNTAMTITNDGRGVSDFTAKAWVNFNGTNTSDVRATHNVSSITDIAVGRYKVNFSNNLGSSNICQVWMAGEGGSNSGAGWCTNDGAAASYIAASVRDHNNSNIDRPYMTALAFGY